MQRQLFLETEAASTNAPPPLEVRQLTEVPATDAAIAALQGFTFDPNDPHTNQPWRNHWTTTWHATAMHHAQSTDAADFEPT